MSEDSLNLVLQKIIKQNLIRHGKIQIKSEKLTPFGGIFSIMEQFDST
ncbi:IS1380 family transposase, partial [Phocaeicola vulgatus]